MSYGQPNPRSIVHPIIKRPRDPQSLSGIIAVARKVLDRKLRREGKRERNKGAREIEIREEDRRR